MFRLTAQPFASTVAQQVVAATHVARLVTWLVTALHQVPDRPLVAVVAMVDSVGVTMSPTTGPQCATSAEDPTTMLETARLKP